MRSEWDHDKSQSRMMREGECQCCMLVRPIERKGRGDQPLCDLCKSHYGDRYRQRREESHRQLWRAARTANDRLLAGEREKAAEDRRSLQAQVRELEHECANLREALAHDFSGRAPEAILNTFQMMKIKEEQDKLAKMRGFVNQLFRALLTVEHGHHPSDDDAATCECGLEVESCDAWVGLSTVSRTLYRWEEDEVDKGRRNVRNELPTWHRDHH